MIQVIIESEGNLLKLKNIVNMSLLVEIDMHEWFRSSSVPQYDLRDDLYGIWRQVNQNVLGNKLTVWSCISEPSSEGQV